MSYKIFVRTVNDDVLTFSVDSYEIEEGNIIKFLDKRTNKIKRFASSNYEIEEVKE